MASIVNSDTRFRSTRCAPTQFLEECNAIWRPDRFLQHCCTGIGIGQIDFDPPHLTARLSGAGNHWPTVARLARHEGRDAKSVREDYNK
jgi:hypothetical protein